VVERTCYAIVVKALNGRTSTIMKATDALMCFIELEQVDKVMVSIVPGGDGCKIRGESHA
jgi:hypothetical protein